MFPRAQVCGLDFYCFNSNSTVLPFTRACNKTTTPDTSVGVLSLYIGTTKFLVFSSKLISENCFADDGQTIPYQLNWVGGLKNVAMFENVLADDALKIY